MSAEFVLDTPVVQAFVAGVESTMVSASSPEQACEAIKPRFAELVGDPDWLPAEYQAAAEESGMGGGIGQRLLYRAEDGSLSLFSLVAWFGNADPRPPRLGPCRPLLRHAGRGDLHAPRGRARTRRTPFARRGRVLRPDPSARRHPPGADDVCRAVCFDPLADERHRLRLAACIRPCVGRADAVPLRLRQRRLQRLGGHRFGRQVRR
jgi:hypothetical protein